MLDLIDTLEAELARGVDVVVLEIPSERFGSFRRWVDLAERLRLRLASVERGAGTVRLSFDRLSDDVLKTAGDYSASSAFAQVNKLDDPRFILDLREAIERVGTAARVLDLGVHRGDELVLLERYLPAASIVAVDRDVSALAVARSRFPRVQFAEADAMALPADLGQFDLVIAIGLLQSGALDDRELLRRIVQRHLAPTGSIILGIPNCRYIAGEIEYGARMRNFTQPELGLVIKDVAFYRKYLQQHHRQVFVTGKHYVFVTAITQPVAAITQSE